MTVQDIYSKIYAHQIEGMMLHEQMGEYYRFLGLEGYADRHDVNYRNETEMFLWLRNYFISHFNMLPPKVNVPNPNAIPEGWYRYKREEVDVNTKRQAVKTGLQEWKKWETETKELYSNMFWELMQMKEIAFANVVRELICLVDKELAEVIEYCLHHKATDYGIEEIYKDNFSHEISHEFLQTL